MRKAILLFTLLTSSLGAQVFTNATKLRGMGICSSVSGASDTNVLTWDATAKCWKAAAAAAAGASTRTYQFNGLNQAGVQGWNLQYDALSNIALSTVDSTHISPLLVVTANTTGSALRSLSLVTSTVTSVIFAATVRSTDTTNSGSIALDYSCQVDGGSLDAPTFTGLTALTLASITTSKTYASTQSVSCTGTASAPARLWVRWTPTAPSGGTLSIAELAVTY